jgi:hypothetical protein
MFDTIALGLAAEIIEPVNAHRIHAFDLEGCTKHQLIRMVLDLADEHAQKADRLDDLEHAECRRDDAESARDHWHNELERIEFEIGRIKQSMHEPPNGESLRDTVYAELDDLWYSIRT